MEGLEYFEDLVLLVFPKKYKRVSLRLGLILNKNNRNSHVLFDPLGDVRGERTLLTRVKKHFKEALHNDLIEKGFGVNFPNEL